ncbi:hypothetical protein WN944_007995 [Citrus x changshan-huyou]|uniref:Secreted protein n=1 Tax=Citrus x changshan-huyou TaxID=2935761 RepID=A0AAP0MM32_9ROSI
MKNHIPGAATTARCLLLLLAAVASRIGRKASVSQSNMSHVACNLRPSEIVTCENATSVWFEWKNQAAVE